LPWLSCEFKGLKRCNPRRAMPIGNRPIAETSQQNAENRVPQKLAPVPFLELKKPISDQEPRKYRREIFNTRENAAITQRVAGSLAPRHFTHSNSAGARRQRPCSSLGGEKVLQHAWPPIPSEIRSEISAPAINIPRGLWTGRQDILWRKICVIPTRVRPSKPFAPPWATIAKWKWI